jgi:hypothetical protein
VPAITVIPEFLWELSLGIYCAVLGFKKNVSSPLGRATSRGGALASKREMEHSPTRDDPHAAGVRQCSLAQILGVWAAAALPMGVLAWVVARSRTRLTLCHSRRECAPLEVAFCEPFRGRSVLGGTVALAR